MRTMAGAMLLRDGRILLGRRAPDLRYYPDRWDILGGHADPGETVEAALVREVREEVGVTPLCFEEIAVVDEPEPERHGDGRLHLFVVTAWSGGEPTMDGMEHSRLCWFDLAEAAALPDLALPRYADLFRALTHNG